MEKARLLIVDDEKDTRDSLKEYLLPRIECEIEEAVNGYEAIELLEKQAFDLMLLDITMPGISGTEVIQKAKEIARDTAIIVITKVDGAHFSSQTKKLGADYIPKPFSLKIVRVKVEEKLKAAGKLTPKQLD